MTDFLNKIIKEIDNEYAALVSDGVEAGDVDSFIDTGSYIFNALLSGSVYGGLPSNKITAFAGESATGKTYFLMGIVKNFLDTNQYICFEQGDDIHFFCSWLWVSSKEEGLKTRGSWDIPKQDYDSNIMYVTPMCVSRKYRHIKYWLKYIKDFLPEFLG